MQRLRNSRGASAVEYALLVALLATILIGSVNVLETVLQSKYENTCEDVGRTPGDSC